MNLTIQGVINILNNFSCWLFTVAIALCIIFIVIAGIRYMFAGGNSERTNKAKKNFLYLLIGIVVILGVGVIISTVAAAVGSTISLIPFQCL